jgi:putative ATP-dependent endonuclease of the OLD family
MKLQSIRLSSLQSFGPEPTELATDNITCLIGRNGSGKTATLQALCRLFAFDPSLRRIQRSSLPRAALAGQPFETPVRRRQGGLR